MNAKNIARLRRARQTRIRIRENGAVRLTVHRSNEHIYAQITSPGGDKVLATASSVEKDVRGQLKSGGRGKGDEPFCTRVDAQAERKGIDTVAVGRAGYKYHGRIKALAEAARSGGLKF